MPQALEVQLSDPAATSSELLAHHYTEVGGQEQVVLLPLGLDMRRRTEYGRTTRCDIGGAAWGKLLRG
jgi:hypothetical protein